MASAEPPLRMGAMALYAGNRRQHQRPGLQSKAPSSLDGLVHRDTVSAIPFPVGGTVTPDQMQIAGPHSITTADPLIRSSFPDFSTRLHEKQPPPPPVNRASAKGGDHIDWDCGLSSQRYQLPGMSGWQYGSWR